MGVEQRVIIDNQEFRVTAWPQATDRVAWGTTHAVREDEQGLVWVHHTGTPSVAVFDTDGRFVRGWGDAYAPGAHGMVLDRIAGRDVTVLSATSLHCVVIAERDGRELLRLACPALPDVYGDPVDATKFVPTEAAVAADGSVYVADGYGTSWIHHYTAEGRYQRSFGGPGTAAGKVKQPHGIKIDRRLGIERERLVVADRQNCRLQYFALNGEHLGFVEGLRFPCTAVPVGDRLYVPDLHSRVSIVGADDRTISHFGDSPELWKTDGWPNIARAQWQPGFFIAPHDLEVARDGAIYVADWMSNGTPRIQKFAPL